MTKYLILFTLCFFAFTVVLCKPTKAFTITKNGVPNAKVIVKENATDPEKYASEEFVKYIEKISGAKLEISQEKGNNNIFIQATGDESNDDSVSIRVDKNNLYIEGASPRSTIYAVYEFLVKYCGVEFYTKDIEQITKNKNIIIENKTDYFYKPPFFSREAYYRVNNQYPEFAVKCKLNGRHNYIDEKLGGHIDLIHWCHSTVDYMPGEKYYMDHPDFFALQKGKRVPGGGSQLCWTNKEMQKALSEEVIAYLDQTSNPKIIDVSQMDNTVYCECEECQKALEKYGSPAGALLETVNAVAKEVKKKYPNVYVETLAYQHTLPAPHGIKADDNVIIRVCDIENNFAEPIKYKSSRGPYEYVQGRHFPYTDFQTQNKDFANNMEAWSKLCNQLYVWDYTVNFSNSHIIHPNLQVLQPNLQYFRDNNVVAMFEQGDYYNESATFNEMKSYLIGKLLWNPDENFDKLRENFCKNVYGKGYKEILQIQDIYTKAITEKSYFLPTYVYDMEWMSEKDYIKSVKLFQSALKKIDPKKWNEDSKSLSIENVELSDYSPYRKTFTAYLDFLYGWYLMSEERQTNIYNAFDFPWKNKLEFEEYFVNYCEKVGNKYASEGGLFNAKTEALELKKSEKIPEICVGLKDEDWFEINNTYFGLYALGLQMEDKDASDGKATYLYPNQTEWSMQCNLSGNIVDLRNAGKKSIDLYAVCKSVNKKNDIGDVATLGIWDFTLNNNRFKKEIPIKDLNDQTYTTIFLGTWEMTNCKSAHFYMCGVDNPECAEAIAIDRIIGVVK